MLGACDININMTWSLPLRSIKIVLSIDGREFQSNVFIGVELFYNVVLVSAVQQYKSDICIYTYVPTLLDLPSHLSGSPLSTELSSLATQQVPISYLFHT